MDNAALTPAVQDGADDCGEVRGAPRFTLLIRAAKLITSQGEFVCVLRDVSETGVCIRLFHAAPEGDPVELHMPSGAVYTMRQVWERDNEVGFEFVTPVHVTDLINEVSDFPKRAVRLGLFFPISVTNSAGSAEALVENLSQQGARFECDSAFAIDQNLRITCAEGGGLLKDIRAKVRWRKGQSYGVVFEDTLTLSEFACFAARIQCPRLLD